MLKDFQDTDGPQPTDWERYAQEEYDLLVAEEGANEPTEGYVKVVRTRKTNILRVRACICVRACVRFWGKWFFKDRHDYFFCASRKPTFFLFYRKHCYLVAIFVRT